MSLEIILIAAVSKNNVIGMNGKIPWNIPGDIKHFRELTKSHPVIMGWKTFESIGRPLPDRLNIVLSKTKNYSNGVFTYSNLDECINDLRGEFPFQEGIDYSKVFLIGGSGVYAEGLSIADRMELTRVHKTVDGDAFFPLFKESEWVEFSRRDLDGFSFISYKRA